MAAWAFFPQNLGSFDKVNCIVIVLWQSSCDSKDVDVKNDVLWREIALFRQDLVGPLAYPYFIVGSSGLALFIKGHYNDCCSIDENLLGLRFEFFFSALQRYAVNDALSLAILKTSFNDFKLGGVNHDWNLGNIWI